MPVNAASNRAWIFSQLMLVLTVICAVHAEAQMLGFYPLGANRGLQNHTMVALLVDHEGYLWAGSRKGLYRYDGYQAIRFMPDFDDPHSISDSDIRSLYQDSNRDIWIATNTGGLNRYHPDSGKFDSWRHDSSDPATISYDSVYSMVEDDFGHLWVGTQIGLNRLDLTSLSFQRYLHSRDNVQSISSDYVLALKRGPEGSIWIGTLDGGLNVWRPGQAGFQHIDLAQALAGQEDLNDVFSLAYSEQYGMFIGTRVGLIRMDPDTAELMPINLAAEDGTQALAITTLNIDSSNRLLAGTLNRGVIVYDLLTEKVISRDSLWDSPEEGLPVMSIASDEKRVYIGTWGQGIYAAYWHEQAFKVLSSGQYQSPLRNRNITAILPGKRAGFPLVGSFGGGIQQIDVEGAAAQETDTGPDLTQSGILSLVETSTGEILAGSAEGLWTIEDNQISPKLEQADDGLGLGVGYITSLLLTENQDLWLGVGGSGLHRRRNGMNTFEQFVHVAGDANSLSGNYITAILELDADTVLVGTRSNGLNVCTIRVWHCTRYNMQSGLVHYQVNALYRDPDGLIWIATNGGLQRLSFDDAKNVQQFENWTREDGLIGQHIMGVIADIDGSLWLSSREGLSRLDPRSGQIQNFVKHNGLPVAGFNANAAARDASYLYFGSVEGLVTVPVGSQFKPPAPSSVQITRLEAYSDQYSSKSLYPAGEYYQMPWGDALTAEFAVMDFSESPHEYFYRLGSKSTWLPLETQNVITFVGLAAGQHEFAVRGRDTFGKWSESKNLSLEVIPPFWMSGWFRALLVLAAVVVVWSAHQFRVRALHKRNVELERLKEQREQALKTAQDSRSELQAAYVGLRNLSARAEAAKESERREISRELHDELGQTLTAAKINLQVVMNEAAHSAGNDRLDETIGMVDGMIQQVRNISLTLRPPLLDEAGLVPALKYYLDSVAKRSGIPIKFASDITASGNSPELRGVLFRVAQEAVNNVVRHAKATRIEVSLQDLGDALRLTIADDGLGFVPDLVMKRVQRGEHLGILGMSERVQAMGGTFELDSEVGGGCKIQCTIPRVFKSGEGVSL